MTENTIAPPPRLRVVADDKPRTPLAPRYLRFADLKAMGIVQYRSTLYRWIADGYFPAGVMLGPNTRAWPEDQVELWQASRTAAPPPPAPK